MNSHIYQDVYNRVTKEQGTEFADTYIKDSGYTHKQAVNISKFGNLDSIFVDFKTGCVVVRKSTTISGIITFGIIFYQTKDAKQASKQALKETVVTFGMVAVSTTITSQMMKISVVRNLNLSDKLAGYMTKKIIGKATNDPSITSQIAKNITTAVCKKYSS